MTDEELAEIERRFQSRIGTDKFLTIFDRDMKDLIAEVRRLNRENEDLKHKLYDERAYSSELRKQL